MDQRGGGGGVGVLISDSGGSGDRRSGEEGGPGLRRGIHGLSGLSFLFWSTFLDRVPFSIVYLWLDSPRIVLRLLSTHSDWFGLRWNSQGARCFWARMGQIEGLHCGVCWESKFQNFA